MGCGAYYDFYDVLWNIVRGNLSCPCEDNLKNDLVNNIPVLVRMYFFRIYCMSWNIWIESWIEIKKGVIQYIKLSNLILN